MCTAVSVHSAGQLFGRNLDMEYSLEEEVILTPGSFPLKFRYMEDSHRHFSFIGAGIIRQGYPLYYDATNEKGLSIAALSFPEAQYCPEKNGIDNVCSFELIPYLLSSCSDVEQCRRKLFHMSIIAEPFSSELPASPLHWLISDKHSSLTVECVRGELQVYDNEAEILTNSPALPLQLFSLNNYMQLSEYPAENRMSPCFGLQRYSRGMGAMGLPGDFSSQSRFIRGFFIKEKLFREKKYEKQVLQFFRLLDSVAQPKGAVRLDCGRYEYTVYTSCCDIKNGIYYFKTYFDNRIRLVDMKKENPGGKALVSFPMRDSFKPEALN